MTKPIRALLLAAGLGTRLKPITEHMPKCLVSVQGQVLLERWLTELERLGCESVLINTHHLSEQVEEFLRQRGKTRMEVITCHEDQLYGTAGTLLTNQLFFQDATGLLIHADNFMEEGLDNLIRCHEQRAHGCILTMLTFETDQPSNCGIVEVDQKNVVTCFHEKVKDPPGTCANGAVYVFDSELLKTMKEIKPAPIDFSNDVIPRLLGKIQSCKTLRQFLDIGTPASLSKAQNIQLKGW